MSSSNVLKHKTKAHLTAEPFIMENFSSPDRGAGEKKEKVGGDSTAIEREAYEKGFSAGEKAGFELGRQKAEVLFQGLSGVIEELSMFRDSLYRRCEKEITELVLVIAKKVVQREMEVKEDSVINCVRAALGAVSLSGRIVIKINPKDMEVLGSHKPELTKYCEGVKEVVLESDDGITRGGCVIETNYGEVDATIEGVFAEIEEILRDAG